MKRTITRKKNKSDMESEIALIKSLVISLVGKDDEGDYRPEFVLEVLTRTKERPTRTFSGKNAFLKLLAPV